jgi:hypothetical protein
MNSAARIPLLSEEGWREAPGWFQSRNLQDVALEPPLAGCASRSRCPPESGGQFGISIQIAPLPDKLGWSNQDDLN